jgi:hypothetical protein
MELCHNPEGKKIYICNIPNRMKIAAPMAEYVGRSVNYCTVYYVMHTQI